MKWKSFTGGKRSLNDPLLLALCATWCAEPQEREAPVCVIWPNRRLAQCLATGVEEAGGWLCTLEGKRERTGTSVQDQEKEGH